MDGVNVGNGVGGNICSTDQETAPIDGHKLVPRVYVEQNEKINLRIVTRPLFVLITIFPGCDVDNDVMFGDSTTAC